MKNIIFQEVGMENYGPYIDPMVLTFVNDKLTLITGPNGIGKTLSIEAIPFTLYGVTSKGVKGDDMVNNKVGKNCKTWVKFKVNDEQYVVTRYHKYTKLGNTVIVSQNKVDILKGHREVLPYIERLICPKQAFMNALMFGQKVKDFFTDLVDSDKKEIFRKIIGLGHYLLYYKESDYKLKLSETDHGVLNNDVKIQQGILDDALSQIEILKNSKRQFHDKKEKDLLRQNKEKEDNERMLDKWKKELDLFDDKDIDIETPQKELLGIDNSLKNSARKFKEMIDQLDQQKKTKLSDLQAIASASKVEVANITAADLESMNENKNSLVTEANESSTRFQKQIHTVETKQSNAIHDIDLMTENLYELESNVSDTENSICPTCEQEVTDVAREKLLQKVALYKLNLKKLMKEESECGIELKKIGGAYKKEAEKYNTMIAMVDREIRRCKREEQEEYEKIDYRFKVAEEKVSELVKVEEKKIISKSNDQTQELQERQFQLNLEISRKEELRKELHKIELNVSNFEGAIISCGDQIRHQESLEYDETQLNSYYKKDIDLSKEISDLKTSMISIDKTIEMLKFWKTGFSSAGIPSMLIDEAIPYMNERVDYYLDMLTNSRYVVSFDTLSEIKSKEFRDKISVHVLDTQTRADSRVQLSGGQTRIIDIAIILTLGDLLSRIQNVSFNILLFDEIFDALDEQNIQYVSRVLSKIKFGNSVYIISHQHQNHLEADEILAFT